MRPQAKMALVATIAACDEDDSSDDDILVSR